MNNDTIPFEDSIFINQEAKYILSLLNDETKSSSWLLSNGIHKIGRLETKEIILDDYLKYNYEFVEPTLLDQEQEMFPCNQKAYTHIISYI